ncbi:MAG: CotH kinase family protein [Pirellulales bacterium]
MARSPIGMRQRTYARPQRKRSRRPSLGCESLEPRMMLAADPVISEFMAINNSTLQDGEGRYSDWIEIHNPGDAAVDLAGWHLTDNAANLAKWTFPTAVVPAGGYLVVFASEDGTPPPGELHTNFRLSGDGEFLALVMPDGLTTTTQFDPYPQQVADVAYGAGVTSEETLRVAADGAVRAHVPVDNSLGLNWTSAAFDDSLWTSGTGGVGYDLDGDYDALIGTDVEAAMHGVNPGAYVRTTFNVADASQVDSLALDIQYDDGFVAYLNGEEVASRNAQSSAVSPTSGLMSYWNFDGTTQDRAGDFANNSGVVADNLSPRGGSARFAAGKVGQALAVGVQGGDATDYTAPLSADVQLPATYAIEAWVMPTELADSWQRLVLNWGGLPEHSYHFAIRNNSGYANSVSLFHGQSNAAEPNANGGTVVLNHWQHIAGVADGNFLRVFLNGVQVDAVPYDGTIHTAASEGLGIADSNTLVSTIRFNGLLDEVAVWSVPLTASQVMSHFQSGALGYGLTPVGASTELQWDSTAPLDRADGAATTVETIDLSSLASFVQPGENVLAIHGLNSSTSDRDFLIRAALRSSNVVVDAASQRYFAVPTPGAPNGTGSADLGPIVKNVAHEILEPTGVSSTTLVAASGPVQSLVPTSDALGLDWTAADYVVGANGETWTSGTGGVGFDTAGDYDPLIGTDVEATMLGANASAYVRSAFDVSDPAAFDRLKLSVKYDDGFVAYLNGQPIASRNTPGVGGISPTTGLATYYSFDGTLGDQAPLFTNNSGVAVDNLVATAAAGALATSYSAGRVGQAVRISRDSGAAAMLTAVDSNDLDLAADWTVEAWVKPDLANTGEWDRFATKWSPGTPSWHWAFRYANNGQDLFLNGAQSINGQTGQPANSVPLDQWSHVAITGNSVSGTISAWLNGVVVATAPYVAVTNGNAPLTLGNFGINDAALQFSGLIDEFAIWKVALTQQQLQSHVNAAASGYGLNPVAGNPSGVTWNAAATAEHADVAATAYEEFDVSQFKAALRTGTNVLAIHGLNVSAADDDFLVAAELVGEAGSLTERPIRVTAEVLQTLEAVGTVALTYRRMFDAEQTTPMFDDGTHGDVVAGDGLFTATLSASVAAPGEMLRYAVTATDVSAVSTREPRFADPIHSPQYFGTVIDDPAIVTQLPVLHRFIQNEAAAETGGGTRASLFYNGEFYDNVFIRIRGGTARSWPKKSYKIEFNDGNHFRFDPNLPRVDEFDLNTTYTDKSYVRAILAYELHRDSGGMAPVTFPVRVEQNGQFFSVADFVEQPDRDFLRRNDLDPDGALYKGTANPTNGLTGNALGAFDKKTRKDENFSDLQALINGLAQSGAALETFVFDNVDLAAQINFMAVNVLLQNIDATDKNFFIYRDTDGDGEWQMLPWDLDLVLGPNALNTDTIVAANDSPPGNTSHPFLGILSVPYNGRKNHLFDAIVNTPRTREMFLRRVRSLMDDFLNAASTPAAERYFEQRLDDLVALLGPDVLLDRARWGSSAHFGGGTYTLQQAVDRIKNEYLVPRRTHLYVTHSADNQPSPVTTVLASGAAARALVPTNGSLELTWTQRTGFDDSAWLAGTSGVGYDEDVTYNSLLGLDLRSTAFPAEQRIDTNGDGTSENDSVYIRIPFNVTDPAALTQLKLRMKYDDGFVAYINGIKVAEASAPASPQWNSAATALHNDGEAVAFVDFDLAAFSGPGGILVAGENILAIHGLNDMTNGTGTSSDMLLLPELVNGTPGFAGSVGIPGGQAEFPPIQFGAIDYNPASGNQDEEYIQLVNPNPFAVDISGWKLSGGVDFTFAGGTVIPTGESLYVASDVREFRARASGPTGGQSLQVVGGYQGHISNFGETIDLSVPDSLGDEVVIASTTTPSTPSDTQQFLRVTEIMYHPADPTAEELAAGFTDPDQFEFIELQNVSATTTLNLAGVSFTGGVSYTFGDVNVPPGGYVVLAVDPAAFAQRYGGSITVAGQYAGNLNNGGEAIKLDDPDGSSIHDFTYDDTDPDWHPSADGGGASLVIVDPTGPLSQWGVASAWRPSFELGGSPGGADLMAGDVDGNLRVDLVDLVIVQRSLGVAGDATRADGDLNGDGAIDRADVAIVARNFGRSYPAVPPAPAAVVASVRARSPDAPNQRRLVATAATARRQIRAGTVDRVFSAALADQVESVLAARRSSTPTQSHSSRRAR